MIERILASAGDVSADDALDKGYGAGGKKRNGNADEPPNKNVPSLGYPLLTPAAGHEQEPGIEDGHDCDNKDENAEPRSYKSD